MKNINFVLKVLLHVLIIIHLAEVWAQTLDDIKNRVGKNNISTTKPISKRKNQDKYEINSVKPQNIKGYKVDTKKGGYINLHGIEINFKINEKGEEFVIPYSFCYFYDKDKNLLDRQKVDFIYAKNSMSPKPFESELTVEGKVTTRVVCSYPANFDFKYVVCVLGDKDNISVMCYPKSSNYNDFDFDEKEMLKNT